MSSQSIIIQGKQQEDICLVCFEGTGQAFLNQKSIFMIAPTRLLMCLRLGHSVLFPFLLSPQKECMNVNLCELAVPPLSCLENPWHAIRPVTDKYLMIILAQANSQVSKPHLYFTSHPKENTVPLSVVRVLKCNRNLRKEPNANDSCKSYYEKKRKKNPKPWGFRFQETKWVVSVYRRKCLTGST